MIHPHYLISHRLLAFVDLFRPPVDRMGMRQGLVLDAAHTALFLPAALAVFSRKDVVSLRHQGLARYPGRRQSPTRDSKPSHPTWTIWTSPLENVKVKSPPTEGAHVAE